MDKKKLIIISIVGISIILIVILLLLLSKSKSNNTYKMTTTSYTYTEEITTSKEDDETTTTTTAVGSYTTTTVHNEQTPTTPPQANTTRKTSVNNNQTTTSTTTTTTTTTTIKHIPKCPEGYTMQNNKCVSEVAKEKVCDSGWWPYSDDLCINMNGEGYEIEKDETCRAGYGYMSIIGFGTPTVYHCYPVKNGTYTCPKGYTMGSESCISIVDPS